MDALEAAKDADATPEARAASVERAWAERADDPASAREAMKSIAWLASNPAPVRVAALRQLAQDASDADGADTRNLFRLMVPVEPNQEVVRFIAQTSAQRGWQDVTPALVRSFARPLGSPPDAERPERAALLALHPGRPLEDVVFDVFATPERSPAGSTARDREEKARTAAWALLARLDVDGSRRATLLAGAADVPGDPMLDALRAAARDLRAVPLTQAQLSWLLRLREGRDAADAPAAREWWAQAARAIASLSPAQTGPLSLRHAEPIRWASVHRPVWLAQSREELASAVRERLRGRSIARRGEAQGVSESFRESEPRLAWGDLLAILIIDEAMRTPGLTEELLRQAERDRLDTSTEYGGLLTGDPAAAASFRVVLYPPRPTQRFDDRRFVASDDMIRDGARALADYHFHAQQVFNRDYAGPGPGDMEFATEHGRHGLVFTPLREGVLNVDYYVSGPDGRGSSQAIVDLGELRVR